MTNRKNIRAKGKILFSEYFKKFNTNDKVAFVEEKSIPFSFPRRIIGRTGKIIGNKGRHKIVQITDGKLIKQFIVHPIHLKKLK